MGFIQRVVLEVFVFGILTCFVAIALTGCGAAQFSGSAMQVSKTGVGADEGSEGRVRQPGDDPANGTVRQGDEDDCDDAAEGSVKQPTVPELVEILEFDPAEAAPILKENRCYISHGGGHGIDVCLAGDKAAISGLWPIEIKGDQLCVPASTLQSKTDLFAKGQVGRCGR